jgi:exodeoxyribonuclease V alpha subunit
MAELEMKRGTVARWKIPPKHGERFGVLLMEGEYAPFAGELGGGIEAGDELAVLAYPSEHVRYGAQFKVQKVIMHLPSKKNLVNWLLLRLPNIGPVRARELKEQFADTIWDVLDSDPMAITVIDGITEERARQIAAAYRQERDSIEVFIELLKLGVDPKTLITLVKKNLPSHQLKDWLALDPYQLVAQGLLKFAPTDEIGETKGVTKDDARRVCGAVVHVLKEKRRDGHTATAYNIVRMESRELLKVKDAVIDAGMAQASSLPFPAHFRFFGNNVQWAELAQADMLFAKVLGLDVGVERVTG